MTRLVTAALFCTFALAPSAFADDPVHAETVAGKPRPVRDVLKKLFVKPLAYPAPRHGANEGMNPAEIQARRAPARPVIDKPFFDPETIQVDETMTDFQVETYLAEKVMIRLIQKEGGKPGTRDRGLSAATTIPKSARTRARIPMPARKAFPSPRAAASAGTRATWGGKAARGARKGYRRILPG